jgi:hypothetical protein
MKKLCFFLLLFLVICGNGLCEVKRLQPDIIDVRIRSYLDCGDKSQYLSIEQYFLLMDNDKDTQTLIEKENQDYCDSFRASQEAQKDNYIEPSYNDYSALYQQKLDEANQYLDLAVTKASKIQLETLKTYTEAKQSTSISTLQASIDSK